MGKLTKEQQAQLAELERLRDSDDPDEELAVWVRNKDGHETRLTGDRAFNWLTRNGYDVDDADDSSKGQPLDPKATPPAKKAAPGKAGDPPADPAATDPPAQDPPAGGARPPRKFF